MPAEPSSPTEPISGPVNPAVPPSAERPAAVLGPPGAGPLARFTRPAEATEPKSPAEQPAERQAAAPPVEATPPGSPAAPPTGYRPRGKGDRPKSRREKEREEDRQVDKELAAERGRGEERSFRAPV